MAEEIDIISDEDLQAPLALGKNYRQLADDFDAVAASAALMTKKIESQDVKISELNAHSKKLETEMKKLEEANKKAAKSQEKYAEATKFADQQTGGMINRVKDLSKQFIGLLANPVGAFLLLIAGALASVGAYFKTTNEGADKFEKIMNAIGGVVDFFTVKIADLGAEIVKMFEEGNALGKVFTFIFDQVVNRVAGAIDFFTNLIKVINILASYDLKELFTGNLKPEDLKALKGAAVDMGKGFVSALTGIGTAADEVGKKIESLNSLTEAADKLGDETRDRILSKAQALLNIEEQLFIFKDKANHTDEQRVKALETAIQISEEQLKIDIDLATRRERQFTAQLLHKKGIITTEQEANKVLAEGTTLIQNQLLEQKAIDSELEERRKLQADVLNLQRDFFAENKKNIAQLGALQKEIDEAAIARAQKETDIRIKKFDEQIAKAKEVSGQEILGLKNSLGMQGDLNKSFNQRLVDETKLRLKQQEEAEKEHNKRMTEELARQEAERRAIIDASIQAVALIGNEFLDRRREKLDADFARSEEQRKKELAGAEGDERKKLAINRKFDREQAKIKTKQAQADKQAALFNIAISTAMGIARVAPNPVLIALVAAIGVIQAALVSSKPLPKFWMGSKNTPSSFIAGDRGREIVSHNGKALIADKPTIFTGMEGSKVFTNRQTEEILGNMSDVGGALSYGSRVKSTIVGSSIVAERMAESNRLLKRIASKPEVGLMIDSEGFHMYSERVAKRNEKLNRYFYGR